MKLILKNYQSPGDQIMLAYAIKSLHESCPGKYLTDVRSSCPAVFEGNPYITKLNADEARVVDLGYSSIHRSNENPVHFVRGFTEELADLLEEKIIPTKWEGAIWIKEEEKWWYSAVYEKLRKDVPYWVLNAGHKQDFVCKTWSFARYQELMELFPDVWFVQVGHKDHIHPELRGDNLIDLVGLTDDRQLIRLVYNCFGVITPVSLHMLLAYSIPPHPRFRRKSRACIVLAGGREPNTWQQGPNQQFLHTCGMLDCCDLGGCWKSKVLPDKDGDDACIYPVQMADGQWISKCMEMISVEEVGNLIDKYMANLDYEPRF